MSSFKRPLKAMLMILLAYLIDACVMPYLAANSVAGSTSFAMIAILTVSYGKKAAFVAGALIGIMMEAMLSGIPALYAIIYPVISALCAQFFADMSERQRERRRTVDSKRRQEELPALVRIPLCAALLSLLMNIANLIYGYLSGFGVTFDHIARSLTAILYTAIIAAIFMLPVRYYLGMYGTRKERRMKRGEKV